jgi:rhamnulose-1-phosphate aldolase/alcohol dehydrogenase
VDYLWNDAAAAAAGDDLGLLVYLSNLVGADPALTQPGGGNSSVKRSEVDLAGKAVEVLRVKGSGTDMRSIGRAGFSGLRLADLAVLGTRERMSDEEMMAFMRATLLDGRDPAPSVETPLHSILPVRFIVHTHDFTSQALTDTPEPEALVRAALGDDVVYVDYVRPGFPLARAVARLAAAGEAGVDRGARGLVLGRHGLVAWGDSARACYDNLHHLVTRAERFVAGRREGAGRRGFADLGGAGAAEAGTAAPAMAAAPPPERRRELARALLPLLRASLGRDRPVILHHDGSDEALAFVGAPDVGRIAGRGMVTPEHILRCGRLPLVLGADLARVPAADARSLVDAALDRYAAEARAAFARAGSGGAMAEPAPKVLLCPGLGLVTATKDKQNAVVAATCYRHGMRVMEAAEALGGFRFLDEKDALEFEHWPLELLKLAAPERELGRQVALVTGAASGIGRAVAERFAAEGAHLVLTDVDGPALRAVADGVAAACKDPHRVVAVEADAAVAADAERAVDAAVLAFGGVDVLVCNAGFVQAGPIDGVSEEIWDRHFDVNVKGTFLAVRAVVPLMKLQRRGAIVINASKGAFAPTADNAAYASAKAAVAALCRNLATELGPHGVRVNAFNADFVDTPMMKRLIAQRAAQKQISVDEQTAEYRRRNLMGTGPIPPAAVAEVALFLASARSRYTTGAAIPVDGGIKEAMPR